MINRLTVENFRGFQHVALDSLRNVNLIVGGNDTGKTSVLEALVILLGDKSAIQMLPITFRTNNSGGSSPDKQNDRENFWSWLFYDRDPTLRISIIADIGSDATLSVSTDRRPAGDYPNAPLGPVLSRTDSRNPEGGGRAVRSKQSVQLLHMADHDVEFGGGNSPDGFRVAILPTRPTNPITDAENYNQVALLADGERRVEKIMHDIEPRLSRLRYAKLPGTTAPLIFADIGLSRAVPSSQMGQAFNRILHIYTQVLAHRTNVLLVDEIENGIFSAAMPIVWRGLLAICEQEGVQIFATTHSRECVMAAHAVARERGKDELCVQRLQIVKGKVEAVRLGTQHLELVSEMGLEIRS